MTDKASTTAFTVKLYGSLMKDTAEFVRKLAIVLEMTESEAGLLMKNLPVAIGERLSRAQANELVKKLSSIQALFLVEQPDEENENDVAEQHPTPTAHPVETKDQSDEARSKFWLWLGTGTLAFLVVFAFFAYLKSYSRVKESQIPKLPLVQLKKNVIDADSLHKRRAELEERISNIESELKQLGEKKSNIKNDLAAALHKNPSEAGKLDRLHYRIQKEAKSLEKELIKARKELDSIQGYSR